MFRSAAKFAALVVFVPGCFAGPAQAPNDILVDGGPDAGSTDAGPGIPEVDGGCPDNDAGLVLSACSDGLCYDLKTDVNNCGTCGTMCSACNDGFCIDVAVPMQPGMGQLTENETDIFWTSADAGQVLSFPFRNNGAVSTLRRNLPSPGPVAVFGQNEIYWAETPSAANSGNIVSMLLMPAGSTPVTLAKGLPNAVGIAVGNATDVFWTQSKPPAIMKVNKTLGGTPSTLVASQPTGAPQGIVVDSLGANVYWADTSLGTIMKGVIASGTASTMASRQQNPLNLAIDSNNLYWTNEGNGSVMRLALTGGTPDIVSAGAPTGSNAIGIAVSTTGIFWTDSAKKAVFRAPVGGGSISTLATGIQDPTGISYPFGGNMFIFVTDPSTDDIYKISPTN